MNEPRNTNSNAKRTSKQVVRERVNAKRETRIRELRERERALTRAVIDFTVNREAAIEHERQAAAAVARLRELGETQQSIADLCEVSVTDIRAALALASDGTAAPTARVHHQSTATATVSESA